MVDVNKLETLAKEKGLSQYRIAKETGISTQYLSELFRGKRTNPTVSVAKDLADILGVKIEDLLK